MLSNTWVLMVAILYENIEKIRSGDGYPPNTRMMGSPHGWWRSCSQKGNSYNIRRMLDLPGRCPPPEKKNHLSATTALCGAEHMASKIQNKSRWYSSTPVLLQYFYRTTHCRFLFSAFHVTSASYNGDPANNRPTWGSYTYTQCNAAVQLTVIDSHGR